MRICARMPAPALLCLSRPIHQPHCGFRPAHLSQMPRLRLRSWRSHAVWCREACHANCPTPIVSSIRICRPIFGDAEVEIEELTKALWDAPFAVLMHEVEASCCRLLC